MNRKKYCRRFIWQEHGAAKTEYILVALLIAIFTISVVTIFGDNIRALFASAGNALSGEEETIPATGPGSLRKRKLGSSSSALGGSAPGAGPSSSPDSAPIGSKGTFGGSQKALEIPAAVPGQTSEGQQQNQLESRQATGTASSSNTLSTTEVPAQQGKSAKVSTDTGGKTSIAAMVSDILGPSVAAAAEIPLASAPVAPTKMSAGGVAKLTELEGYELKEYKDVAGYSTIGVGHLLTSDEIKDGTITINGTAVAYKDGLTQQQVQDLLSQDLEDYNKLITDNVKVTLTQDQFDALVSFSYNVGPNGFKNSNLLKVLNEGKYDQVPGEMRKWTKAGGVEVQGLVNRRETEVDMWNGTKQVSIWLPSSDARSRVYAA